MNDQFAQQALMTPPNSQALKQIQSAPKGYDEGSYRGNRGPYQSTLRELSDRSTLKNVYINDIILYTYNKHDALCVKCGELRHTSRECPGPVLPA